MGLDIYVGPLSRYYTGDWETIIQRYARENGMQVQVVRPAERTPNLLERLVNWFRRSPDVADVVSRWKEEVSVVAGVPLEWDDRTDRDYFTDKPAWDCYGALILFAAYEELGKKELPATAEDWGEDSCVRAAAENFDSKYRHLLNDTEFWLPAEFSVPFRARTLDGANVTFGSTGSLLEELKLLNESSWNASEELLDEWRHDGADYGAPFETSARFGFAVVYQLTQLAVQHRLPMKLDY